MWDVIVRTPVRPLVDAVAGKRIGYGAAFGQLCADPCASFPTADGTTRPFAYRLSGPLGKKVCGLHLKRGYRLAFTMRPAESPEHEGIVEILYVGERDTRQRSKDAWTVVHHIFGEMNPLSGHLRPPCCEEGLPEIDEQELLEVMDRLRRFQLKR